ncbi:DsbA family protein [Bdellovibrio sp. HCB274]|uniref:DsbA family protein n=1 Tax=Bdellovibrio sp. HCB274 TaxID=3394361 RepID=UPI0039B5C507
MKSSKYFVAVAVIAVIGTFILFKHNYKNAEAEKTPEVKTTELIKEHNPRLGPDTAEVKIVEFLDPECEACSAMAPIVKQLMKEYDGKVQLIVRYMPFHGNSMMAATYLEEAREKGKYWESLSALFENLPAWGDHHAPKPELIPKFLVSAGVSDAASFEENVLLSKHRWKVDADFADGKMLGVTQTPTFFVNGKKLEDIGYEPIKQAIENELKK